MHEMGIAESLVNELVGLLKKNKGARIETVNIELGPLAGIDAEALDFAFTFAAEDTPAKGAKLVLEKLPLMTECLDCGKSAESKLGDLKCEFCGSGNVKIIKGREMIIKSVELIEG